MGFSKINRSDGASGQGCRLLAYAGNADRLQAAFPNLRPFSFTISVISHFHFD